MYLQKLSLVNFKNYAQAEIEFAPKLNCIIGNNAMGKTNILDAIHYLCLTKSYFNVTDALNIKHNEDFFVLQGHINQKATDDDNDDDVIYCGVKRNKKKQFLRNKKEYSRLADHIGLFPVVMVSPSDGALITDGSEERRKFINNVISQLNKDYLSETMKYNRLLLHRNKMLKDCAISGNINQALFEVVDEQLAILANHIHLKRKEFIDEFIPVFENYYADISNNNEQVNLTYQSDLNDNKFETILSENLNKDLSVGYTTKGIHKDDLIFKIGDYQLKKHGSQGQQKTYLVALKLAKYQFIKNALGKAPFLLLDDIFDKFDTQRVTLLLKIVAKNSVGQIFLTDTSTLRLDHILSGLDIEHKVFNIDKNGITSK